MLLFKFHSDFAIKSIIKTLKKLLITDSFKLLISI